MRNNSRKTAHKGMGLIILFMAASGLVSGILLPFFFESQSLWYKFGAEKAMLRYGKAAGLAALVLILCQPLWVSRLGALAPMIPAKRSHAVHRISGMVIVLLALVHPLLILWSGGFTAIPFELRYWPEFTGIFLALLILVTAITSLMRGKLKIPPSTWQRIHRLSTLVITIIALIHARAASETFNFQLPGIWLGIALAAALVLFTRLYFNRFKRRRK